MLQSSKNSAAPVNPEPKLSRRTSTSAADDRLAVLHEVTLALNSTLNPGELLDRILDASIRYTGATTGSVVLIGDDGRLRIVASRGLGSHVMDEVVLRVGEGITGWVADNNKPLNVSIVREDPRYVMVKEHIRSELAVPMVLGNRVIGVISVDSSREANFRDDDMQVLTFVGAQAAQILENAKAFDELQRKNDRDETLVQISHALGSALDFREMFEKIGQILAQRCDMHQSFLVLLNPDTDELAIELAHGMTAEEIGRGRYQIGEGVTGQVVQTGESVAIRDVSSEPRFLGRTGIDTKPGGEPTGFLAVPVNLEGKAVGTLGAMKPFPGEAQFGEDLELLKIIGSTVAQAMRIHFRVLSERKRLLQENRLLREDLKTLYKFDNLVGSSPNMQRVYSTIQSVSRMRSTVLIRGESGTGKELIAHAIHFNSPRADKPFVKVNCGAIPENLLEAELFGHVKGSFTGAIADRKGKFEQAHGGTLLLDEIGDMTSVLQVKILRVLQELEVEPVGSNNVIKVDVRILAATHEDLEELVSIGKFREDLYYRLNVVPIEVPPLRERGEDIPALVEHFMERYCRDNDLPLKRLTREAFHILMGHDWPGNVRELENILERATILAAGEWIRPEDLPSPLGRPLHEPRSTTTAATGPRPAEDPITELVESAFERPDLEGHVWDEVIGRVETVLLKHALEHTAGVRLRAADILGIHRNTLRKKLTEQNGREP